MQKLILASFERMKALLFPFHLNTWLNIIFVVWMAGAAGGGGGGTGGLENLRKLRNLQQQKPVATSTAPIVVPSGAGTNSAAGQGVPASVDSASESVPQMPKLDLSTLSQRPAAASLSRVDQMKTDLKEKMKKFWPWVLAGLLLIGIPLMLLMSWLNARFNFILIEFLVQKNLTIRKSFSQNRDLGNSLFMFNLFFLLGVILYLGCMVGLFFLGKVGIIFGVLGSIAGILAMVVISMGMNDFVIPLMYHQRLSAGHAARFFWEQDFEWGKVFMYYLAKIGLGIVASILLGILSFIGALAVIIPAGIVLALLVWLVKAKFILSILLVIFGGIAVIALILLVSLVALPCHIFFQCFRLGFVTHLLPQFAFFEESDGSLSAQA